MKKINLDKWENLNSTEGLLYFAQCFCEMLNDDTMDSYKSSALNLHLSILELKVLSGLYCEGRLKKGSLNFSVNEFKYKARKDIVFEQEKKELLLIYASEIESELSKSEVNKEKFFGLISAAALDIGDNYWEMLKLRTIELCKTPREKKSIKKLCQELTTEIILKGFSKAYALAKAEKFFFSPRATPQVICAAEQVNDFLTIFEESELTWDVVFLGSKVDNGFIKHVKIFDAKILNKTPNKYGENTKYREVTSCREKGEAIYSVTVAAYDPHAAREVAESQLNFFADVCRFHQHNKMYSFREESFVFSRKHNKSYILKAPRKPMQCGATFKNTEQLHLFHHTLEILQGKHFTVQSVRAFHKILDFHHAALSSSNCENQLLDLWAALEGFLPAPDGSSDRMVITPFLIAVQSRAYAACLSFMAGVMPPMPMFGRSLL